MELTTEKRLQIENMLTRKARQLLESAAIAKEANQLSSTSETTESHSKLGPLTQFSMWKHNYARKLEKAWEENIEEQNFRKNFDALYSLKCGLEEQKVQQQCNLKYRSKKEEKRREAALKILQERYGSLLPADATKCINKYRCMEIQRESQTRDKMGRYLEIVNKLVREQNKKNAGLKPKKIPTDKSRKKMTTGVKQVLPVSEESATELEKDSEQKPSEIPAEVVETPKSLKEDDTTKKEKKKKSGKKEKATRKEDKPKKAKPPSPKKGGKSKTAGENVIKPLRSKIEPINNVKPLLEEASKIENLKDKEEEPKEREFEPAVRWKPDCIVFQDFKPKRTYKKKVGIMNITTKPFKCRFIKVEMQDVFLEGILLTNEILSVSLPFTIRVLAGSSADFDVIFKPTQPDDLQGFLVFYTEERQFKIPFSCLSERAEPHIDPERLHLGNILVGMAVTKKICVSNKGSLDCSFQLSESTSENILEINSAAIEQMPTERNENSSKTIENSKEQNIASEKQYDYPKQDLLNNKEHFVKSLINEVIDNVFSVFQFSDKYYIKLYSKSYVQLKIKFRPQVCEYYKRKFILKFDCKEPNEFAVVVSGNAYGVPMTIVTPEIDFKICPMNRSFQGNLMIRNDDRITHSVSITIPRELLHYVTASPKNISISSKETVVIGVKLFPKPSLIDDASKYLRDENILDFPINIHPQGDLSVAEPLTAHVQAILTTNSIDILPTNIDFGTCTTHETVTYSIMLVNHSLVDQEFGFINVQKFVSVQPNHGFGIVLGNEDLSLEVLYSPTSDCAGEHLFSLVCRTTCGAKSSIQCRAHVKKPLAELSHQVVQFPATPCFSSSVVSVLLHAINLSSKQYEIATCSEAGCKSYHIQFQFQSDNHHVSVAPQVGRLQHKQHTKIHLVFHPEIETEELQMKLEMNKKEEEEKRKQEASKKGGKKKGEASKKKEQPKGKTTKKDKSAKVEELEPPVNELFPVEKSLLEAFEPNFSVATVTCFVQGFVDGETKPRDVDVLYMTLICPVIRPNFIPRADHQKKNFGYVAVGDKRKWDFDVQSVSNKKITVSMSALSPVGEFYSLFYKHILEPEHLSKVVVIFAPEKSEMSTQVTEYFEIKSNRTVAPFMVTGIPEIPKYEVPDVPGYRFPDTKLGMSSTWKFEVKNICRADLKFSVEVVWLKSIEAEKLAEVEAMIAGRAATGEEKKGKKGNKKGVDKKGKGNKKTAMFDVVHDVEILEYYTMSTELGIFTSNPLELTVTQSDKANLQLIFQPQEPHRYAAQLNIMIFKKEVAKSYTLFGTGI